MKWKVNRRMFDKVIEKHSTDEINKKTGYSRQVMYGWKKGWYNPSVKAILSLCNGLGYNPASFFEIEGAKSIKNPLLNGEGEIEKMDVGTQYTFNIGENTFAIVPLSEDVLEIIVYEPDEDSFGFIKGQGLRVRERIKIRVKK